MKVRVGRLKEDPEEENPRCAAAGIAFRRGAYPRITGRTRERHAMREEKSRAIQREDFKTTQEFFTALLKESGFIPNDTLCGKRDAPSGNRTQDLPLTRRMLYQLS